MLVSMTQQMAAPKINTLAVVAMIFSFIVPPVGIVLGHVALHRIKRLQQGGHSLALAATVLGYIFFAVGVVLVALFVVLAMAGLITFNGVTFCSGNCPGTNSTFHHFRTGVHSF
jgi:hypothetical protein